MHANYDSIGRHYHLGRRTDPRIAQALYAWLHDAESILNIGAGTGSYEPEGLSLMALEPSIEMIQQRSPNAYPVKQGKAEALPFDDLNFSHSMSVLSMHHWSDRKKAFAEIRRVTARRFVALTWNPEASAYWLTRDYFPEIHAIDRTIFPSITELQNALPGCEFHALEIPADCVDGFTAAYWARPEAYLDPMVRASMSTFTKIAKLDDGLQRLKKDLDSGVWLENNKDLLDLSACDLGYGIVVWDVEGESS